jgi:hypothetical protein
LLLNINEKFIELSLESRCPKFRPSLKEKITSETQANYSASHILANFFANSVERRSV